MKKCMFLRGVKIHRQTLQGNFYFLIFFSAWEAICHYSMTAVMLQFPGFSLLSENDKSMLPFVGKNVRSFLRFGKLTGLISNT